MLQDSQATMVCLVILDHQELLEVRDSRVLPAKLVHRGPLEQLVSRDLLVARDLLELWEQQVQQVFRVLRV